MTKVDIRRLDSVTTNDTTATQLINENFEALQEAIENTISRDGTTPNFMDADLDLNSYKIINAGTPTNNTDVITKEYFDEHVGDAAGYSAAAEASANRAAQSAQAAQGYSTVATNAADIAQNAKDYIQNDPGFQTVVADLQLGENGSMYKVNANKTNIDTVAGSITNVNSVGTDIANVNAVAADLTNIDNVADDLTNINAVANNETNINAVNANKTNIDAVAANNIDISAVAADLTNIDAVAADLTNIDAASDYAAEAKQWAIGEPTEPTEGSAKYWAGQAAAGQIQADWAEADTSSKAYIRNKPTVDASPTQNSTNLVQSGGVYTGLNTLQQEKANISLSNLSSAGQAVLDAKQDVASAVNYNNISNCITEIPQDIKLELNNGTLTLKAGSKVYVPNGSGVFDVVTISSDLTSTFTSSSNQRMFFWNNTGGYIQSQELANIYSGSTAPTGSETIYWYDTTNNLIKRSTDGGSTWGTNKYSLPLGLFSVSNNNISSIDQVFNGFGYIGSTVFALPGVKGLIPDGRNADGTLKNINCTTNNVLTSGLGNGILYFSGGRGIFDGFAGPTEQFYNEEKNIIDFNGTKVYWSECIDNRNYIFSPKTAFHAVDYNDFSDLKDTVDTKANDSDVVKLTGNQNISGTKTFTETVRTYQNDVYVRPLEFKNIAVTDNANPASVVSTELALLAGTNNVNEYLGSFGFQQQPDGYHNTYMRVGNSTSGTFVEGRLGIQIASDGTAYGYAPTPATTDNSTKIATTAFVVNVLKEIYPVGSCFIGMTSTCPLAALFGTWTLQSSGIVTSVDTNVPVKGNGMTLGMTNGTDTGALSTGASAGQMSLNTSYYGVNVNTTGGTIPYQIGALGVTTDASKSGIVGTVTRSTLSVNIWKRTA